MMQFVRETPFAKNRDSGTSPYEYEAVSLARSLDLRLPTYPTAYHLLCADPSVEVDVRRLYALIQVENEVAEGKLRQIAWEKAASLLETTPHRKRGYKPADDEMNQYFLDILRQDHYLAPTTRSQSSRAGRGRGRDRSSHHRGKRTKSESSSHNKENQEN